MTLYITDLPQISDEQIAAVAEMNLEDAESALRFAACISHPALFAAAQARIKELS